MLLIQHFVGDLTEKWKSDSNDSPKRDLHTISAIAVQEVNANLNVLRHTMKLIGDKNSVILTDLNQRNVGNEENMTYIFDSRRVQLSDLASE